MHGMGVLAWEACGVYWMIGVVPRIIILYLEGEGGNIWGPGM